MPQLSVIMPLYNAERYLHDSLDSLQAQTYEDIEIVCVNDGSSDSSRAVALERARRDGRIRVVDKENGGPSSARNVGIRAAAGDYVCFLDADDTYEPAACERIMDAFASGEFDMVVFGGNCLPADKADRRIVRELSPKAAEFSQFSPDLLFERGFHPYIRYAFKRAFLLENGIFFDEELRVGEDEALAFNAFPAARGVKVIPDKLYNYVQFHEGSQMSTTKATDARQCAIDQKAAEHVFRDCRANGIIARCPFHMLWWSVRFSAYSVLRQPPEVRNPLVARIRAMWLANCTDDELETASREPCLHTIVEAVLTADDSGAPTIDERVLARALRTWRLKEYGPGDALVTAWERLRHGA